jgi:hypothetical protein
MFPKTVVWFSTISYKLRLYQQRLFIRLCDIKKEEIWSGLQHLTTKKRNRATVEGANAIMTHTHTWSHTHPYIHNLTLTVTEAVDNRIFLFF